MKKRLAALIIFLAIFSLFTGCGKTKSEEKVSDLQNSNTITVQDVTELMELEGLKIENLTPSNEFKEKWPKGELIKINGEHYMALQSFEENLWERKSVMRDTGWFSRDFSAGDENDISVTAQLAKDYLNYRKNSDFYSSSSFSGKNLSAILLYSFPENINEMSKEEMDLVFNKISSISDTLKRVFDKHINNISEEEIFLKSENFEISGTLSFYQTGVIDETSDEAEIFYDAHSAFLGEVKCSDEVWEKYKGQEYEITAESPKTWTIFPETSTLSSTVPLENNILDIPNCHTEEILWTKAEDIPSYTITIKIGDLSETFQITPDL